MNAMADDPLSPDGKPDGICYAYTAPVRSNPPRLKNTVIDYSHNPDAMLRYVESPGDDSNRRISTF